MLKQSRYSMLWDSYLQSIKAVSMDGNLSAASKLLASALDDATDYCELDERLEWCIYGIADEYCARGEHAEAQKLYMQLLEVKEKLLGCSHPNVQAGLEKLAIGQFHLDKKRDEICKNSLEASLADQPAFSNFFAETWKKVTTNFRCLPILNLVNTVAKR